MAASRKQQRYAEHRASALKQASDILEHIGEMVLRGDDALLSLTIRNSVTQAHQRISCARRTSQRSFVLYLALIQQIHSLLYTGQHATKRDLFYQNTSTYVRQASLDRALENLAATFGVPRDALNVHASEKGLAFGDAAIELEGGTVSCKNGGLIPRDDLVVSVEVSGFALVVEKDAVFHTIRQDYDYLRSILGPFCLITGKGYPDKATLDFLRGFPESLPVFVLVDYDPHGLEIFWQYRRQVNCRKLGLSYDDIGRFNEYSAQRLKLTCTDARKVRNMLAAKDIPDSLKVDVMRLGTTGFKAELELMSDSSECRFFTRSYLAVKLKEALQQTDATVSTPPRSLRSQGAWDK